MNNAFSVRLSISLWSARKLDKSASRDTKARAGAGDKAGVKVYSRSWLPMLWTPSSLSPMPPGWSIASGPCRGRMTGRLPSRQRAIPHTRRPWPALRTSCLRAVAKFITAYEVDRRLCCPTQAIRSGWRWARCSIRPTIPWWMSCARRFAFSVAAEPMAQADDFRVQGLAAERVAEIQRRHRGQQRESPRQCQSDRMAARYRACGKTQAAAEGYKPAAANGGKVEGKFHDSLSIISRNLSGCCRPSTWRTIPT